MKLKILMECTVDESGNISGLKFEGKSHFKGPALRSSILSREHWSNVRHMFESSFNLEAFKVRKLLSKKTEGDEKFEAEGFKPLK